ncbi:MAG: hypothetical protein M3R00_06095 [Pseudomonadota bacterium]|nr:hypothetical protein [Pseudomonadota bacterium]
MFLRREKEIHKVVHIGSKTTEALNILVAKRLNKCTNFVVQDRRIGKVRLIEKWDRELSGSFKPDLRILLLLAHLSCQPYTGFSTLPFEILCIVAKMSMSHIKFSEHVCAELSQFTAQYRSIYNSGYHNAIVLWKPQPSANAAICNSTLQHNSESINALAPAETRSIFVSSE